MKKHDSLRNYNLIDIVKFCFALLIIGAHFVNERGGFPFLLDSSLSIYIVVVPFFYATSGFLLFRKLSFYAEKEKNNLILKYLKRVLFLYMAWSIIYVIFVIIGWFQNGLTFGSFLTYLHECIVYSTYSTIWFLPSLVVAVIFVFLFSKYLSYMQIFILSLFLYALGSLGYSYSFLLKSMPSISDIYASYNLVFLTTRNGIFNGSTFVALGAVIASSTKRIDIKFSGFMSLVLLGLMVLEAVLLKVYFNSKGADTVVFLVPFTYFFLEFLLSLEMKNRKIYKWMRNMSLLMFLSQRLFLTAIPSIIPSVRIFLVSINSFLGLFIILGVTFVFSTITLRLSEKYKLLKSLF